MLKKIAVALLFIVSVFQMHGQVPIVGPDRGMKTGIAPAFFGPNAFQVPEMLDGTVSPVFKARVAGDRYYGHTGAKDDTYGLFVDFSIPLFSDRVNLSVWWEAVEFYDMSRDVADFRRVGKDVSLKGRESGPLYVSVDIQLLREGRCRPALALRSVLRTASEDYSFASARSYDAPGYFFDLAAGKGFGPFRIAASTGFLCWQTDNGRQNDAVMLAAKASYTHDFLDLSAQYGTYIGWERYGDNPHAMLITAALGGSRWLVNPFVSWQHGFKDWPFDQLRLGLSYSMKKR